MQCPPWGSGYRCCLSAVALALVAFTTHAQEINQPASEPIPLRLVEDTLEIWRTPFRTETYRNGSLTKYVLPFAFIAGGLVIADHKIANHLPNTQDQTRWCGRISQFGASYTTAGFAAATFLTGQLTGKDRVRETGLLSLEAIAQTQLLVFAVKQITNRQRPIDNQGQGSFWQGGNSFPSGHAATAFAVASVFSQEYSHNKFVPLVAYSSAGLIAVSRPGARRHWMSDIVVGSATGYLLGRFVYKKRHDPRLDPGKERKPSTLIPRVGFTGGGVGMGWQW